MHAERYVIRGGKTKCKGYSMRGYSLLLGLSVAVAGCAAQRIDLAAGPGQDAIVRDGVPALVSKKRNVVMLRPNSRLLKGNSRPAFTVVVKNQGDRPETLLETNITAKQAVEGKQVAMRVYRYDELVQEEQTRQTIQAVGVALSAAGRSMNAANAGHVNTTGSISTYGPYGNTYGTYTANTYDPYRAQAAQSLANAQTQADIESLQEQGDANLAALSNTILKDNTVMPGEWIGGTIVLATPTGYTASKA